MSSSSPIHAFRPWLYWAALLGLTLLAWHLEGWQSAEWFDTLPALNATLVILVISMVKIRLVIREFMAIRSAPVALRWAFELWCLVVLVALLYLFVLPEPGQ